MAGKSHKNNKGKAKTGVVVGKPLSSTDTPTTTVGVREVPVLASATGLPELGLKRPAKPVPTAAAGAGVVPVVVESSSSPGVKESIVPPEEVASSNGKQEGTTTLAEAVPASTAPQETEVPEKAMAASKDEDSSEHSGGEGEGAV
jgi:hypothetical protein